MQLNCSVLKVQNFSCRRSKAWSKASFKVCRLLQYDLFCVTLGFIRCYLSRLLKRASTAASIASCSLLQAPSTARQQLSPHGPSHALTSPSTSTPLSASSSLAHPLSTGKLRDKETPEGTKRKRSGEDLQPHFEN